MKRKGSGFAEEAETKCTLFNNDILSRRHLLPRLTVVLNSYSIKANNFTASWMDRNAQRVSVTLKNHGLMKDGKVLELFTKMHDVILRKHITWDEIDDELIENKITKQ